MIFSENFLSVERPISTQEKFPRTEHFPKISLLKVEESCVGQSHFTIFSFRGKFSWVAHAGQYSANFLPVPLARIFSGLAVKNWNFCIFQAADSFFKELATFCKMSADNTSPQWVLVVNHNDVIHWRHALLMTSLFWCSYVFCPLNFLPLSELYIYISGARTSDHTDQCTICSTCTSKNVVTSPQTSCYKSVHMLRQVVFALLVPSCCNKFGTSC
jgi:hypothetical protein